MNQRNRTIFVSVVAIVALACACPASGGIPGIPGSDEVPTFAPISTIPPVPTLSIDIPNVPQNVALADDFSSDNGEFESYDGDTGSAGYKNGIYFVRSESDPWEWGRSTTEFADATIEIDISMAEGPANNNAGLGVICRLSEDGNGDIDGYLLAISADGYYYIGNIVKGDINAIVDWTSSNAINLGSGTNRISASCIGNELTLAVNGEVLDTAIAPAGGSTSGSIGFSVTSYESQNGEPIAEGHFDNLVVSAP
jgi:hypothetical protein